MLRHLALALALTLLCCRADAAERRYIEVAAPGLILISAANEGETREIVQRIAMFRAAIELALGVTLSREIPTRIYALSDRDWQRYAQPRAGLSGYFLSHPFSSDLVFNMDDATSDAYELMFHEYVHHIVRTFWAGEVPAFLDEGLAEVFSNARFRGGRVILEPRKDYVSYLRSHEWLPFERLLEVKRSDPEYLDHKLAPAFYAQAWATMYYATAADPAFGARVAAFVRDLSDGSTRLNAAERLLAGAGVNPNQAIADFIRRRERLPIAQIEQAGAAARNPLQPRKLADEESTLAIGELMLRAGGRHEQAQDLFEQIGRRNPENLRARVGQARARLQARDWQGAAEILETLNDAPVPDPETALALGQAYYYLATATSAGEQKLSPGIRAQISSARALFDSAMDNRRTRLPAISGYVLASLALDEHGDDLLLLAQIAYRRAPKSTDLAVALAILHELKEDKATAREYWQQAARSVHTAPVRARILNALQASESRPD